MSTLVMDVKEYAKLLNSVGQQGEGPGRKRPLTPVQCADAIRRLQKEEGEKLEKIAVRLGLGRPKDNTNMYKKRDTSQISMFLNLHKVSEKSRNLAGWNTDPWPKIPFSTIAQLSSMNPEDQDLIIQSILSSNGQRMLGKEDVKKIKKWRGENPELPMQECIEKVLNLKPVVTVTYILVMEVRDSLHNLIRSNPDWKNTVLELLRDRLPGKFHNVGAGAGASVVTISMDEEAYHVFHENQYDKGISYTQFLDKLLENRVE